MKKVNGRWVGSNTAEQLKIDRSRWHSRRAYAIWQAVEDGNKTLLRYEGGGERVEH